MFGKCVWYKIITSNSINKLIFDFSKKYGTPFFYGHLTADYAINLPYNDTQYTLDDFVIVDAPYQTESEGFFAYQQDYCFKTKPSKRFHISIAYKLNIPFTTDEIEYLNNMKIPEEINKKDIELQLWDCNSKNPIDWRHLQ